MVLLINFNFINQIKMYILFSIISGTLLALSYNYNILWGLSFIALIPLLNIIYNVDNSKKAYIYSHLTGFIFLGLIFLWIFETYPLVWLQTENLYLNFFSVFIVWLVTVVLLSSVIGFFGLTLFKFKNTTKLFSQRFNYPKKTFYIYSIVLISSLWIIFEYLRVWLYFFQGYSSEALFGAHYTFGLLGYNLANSQTLLQLVGIGGAYFLSFLVVLINAILFFIFVYKYKKGRFLIFFKKSKTYLKKLFNPKLKTFNLILIIIFFSLFIFYNKSNTNTEIPQILNVAVLQTKFLNPSDKNNNLNKFDKKKIYEQILIDIKNNEPKIDVILFPESTDFIFDLVKNNQIESFYKNLWPQKEVLIIDSAFVRDYYGNAKSIMYYYDIQSQSSNIYEKQLLVPTGETMPYLAEITLKILKLSEGNNYFEKYKSYLKSDQKIVGLGEFKNSKIGILFCSEIFSPKLYQDLIFQGAELIGLSASYSTFRGSSLLLSQLEKIAKVRAVENNRYFIQSSNFGYSFVLNNKGKIIEKTDKLGNSYLTAQVELIDKNNLYIYLGDWILWFSMFFLIIQFLTGLLRGNLMNFK